jgi:2-octaprenyl-6-methoxyphenol hydroxylase
MLSGTPGGPRVRAAFGRGEDWIGRLKPSSDEVDVLVIGTGAAGLSAAIALAHAGFSVVASGALDIVSNGRTVALFEGSLRFLRAQNLWPRLADLAAEIRSIEMIDASGSRVPIPRIVFSADEVGLPALGANIETDRLVARLTEIAHEIPNLHRESEWLVEISDAGEHIRATFASGRSIIAKLIVAADGQRSAVRTKARIGTRRWNYPQVAMTALTAHALPHANRSVEFHTRSGPCTLVPLTPREGAEHRSSLVWLMTKRDAERRRGLDAAALAAEIEREVESIYGSMRLDGACGFFPMMGMTVTRLTSRRIALLGEAAHAFPPLAAQGLNLSLRDIGTLVGCVEAARARGDDIGAASTLRPYAEARRPDIALRTSGIDILNRSLLSDFLPVDLLRGLGSLAFATIAPLRRAIILEGILPHGPSSVRTSPRPDRRIET